jgi:hypothetical protein
MLKDEYPHYSMPTKMMISQPHIEGLLVKGWHFGVIDEISDLERTFSDLVKDMNKSFPFFNVVPSILDNLNNKGNLNSYTNIIMTSRHPSEDLGMMHYTSFSLSFFPPAPKHKLKKW